MGKRELLASSTYAVTAGLVLCSCSTDAGGRIAEAQVVEPALVTTALLRESASYQEEGDYGLFRPSDIDVVGDRLVIVDTGNDRLVVFDTLLRARKTIGRSGAGPGELQVPLQAEIVPDGYVVGDLTNRRLSYFDVEGAYLRSVRIESGPLSLAVASDGRAYLPTTSRDHYLKTLDEDGRAEPFGRRPPPLELPASERVGLTSHIVAVTEDAVHVFDNNVGVLVKYSLDGRFQLARRLPATVLDRLVDRRDGTREAFAKQGVRILSMPLAKGLSTTPAGRLLLLFTSKPEFGALVDPETYRTRLLRVPSATAPWEPLLAATAMTLHGETLYALSGDRVYAYALGCNDQSCEGSF